MNDLDPLPETAPAQRGSILAGVGLVAAAHLVAAVAVALFGALSGAEEAWMLFGIVIGAAQTVYVVPLALWLNGRGDKRTAKGVWIGAGVTALLNAACFGVVMGALAIDGVGP